MKASNVTIGIRKNENEEMEGYFYYREKAIASIKGQKKVTKNGKQLIELFIEGKEPEKQIIEKNDGTTYEIEKADITLFVNQTEKGSISVGGDLITDFGLYFPIQGWLDKERLSIRLEENDYVSAKFLENYGTPVTSIPDIDFSDEDLAQSDELFPDAASFYQKYVVSKKDARFTEKLNKQAPRIMPSLTKKKAPVTQGQLDLAKDNLVKAKANVDKFPLTAVETEEIPF
jgi:hypothetical protein